MLPLKHVAKSRVLLSPLLFLNTNSNNKPIYIFPIIIRSCLDFYSTAPQAAAPPPALNAREVALSFKEWFAQNPQGDAVFDRIFQVLSAHNDEDSVSRYAADQALSQMGIRLTESFVLQVLNYGKSLDVLSCLKFFDWAGRQQGFLHTRATFHAIFRILDTAQLKPLMLEFLDNFKKYGYYRQVSFNDALVMGYSMAGKPEIALHLFGKMRFNGLDLNGYVYHVLLNALVENDCFDAASVISKQISLRGFESDVTRSIIIKSMCKQNRLDDAVEYFHQLVSGEEYVSGFMIGAVVDGLCKSGKFEQAGKLLEDFRDCNRIMQLDKAYGIWLRNLVHAGRLHGALGFLKSKNSFEGYVPEVFRFNFLVSRLLKENRLTEVFELFMEMIESQISPDRVTMNTALCFFCKAGMVDVAVDLYNSRSEFGLSPNALVYNYLINSLCGNGNSVEAFQMLKNSVDQGSFLVKKKTISILADALCRDGKFEQMTHLVIFALEQNCVPDDDTFNKFIAALCKARREKAAYLIYEELARVNKVASKNTYFHLIRGFCKSHKGDIAASLFIQMQDKGYKPSRALYRAVIGCICDTKSPAQPFLLLLKMQLSRQETDLRIYSFFIDGAGHAKQPDLARAVYELMQKSGIQPNLGSNILLLQSYLKSQRISDALNFFNQLRLKEGKKISKKLYNAMIVGLCNAMKGNTALRFMSEMKSEGMSPSMECYELLIKLLCSTRNYEMVVHVISDLEAHGRNVTSFVGNMLLYHALRTQELYEAWIRLRGILLHDKSKISVLGQLIGVFSGRIRMSENIDDLQKKIEQCFPPNTWTYNMLLRQLSISGIDNACDLFNKMHQKGCEPNCWTFDILKNGLYKCLRTDETKRRLVEMPSMGFIG